MVWGKEFSFFPHMAIKLFQHHVLKRLCFPTCTFVQIFRGLFLDSVLSHWSFCLSLPRCCTVLITINLKISSLSLPALLIFFKIILAILGSLYFYIHFKIGTSVSTYTQKRVLGSWLGGVECLDQFGENWCENIWSHKAGCQALCRVWHFSLLASWQVSQPPFRRCWPETRASWGRHWAPQGARASCSHQFCVSSWVPQEWRGVAQVDAAHAVGVWQGWGTLSLGSSGILEWVSRGQPLWPSG